MTQRQRQTRPERERLEMAITVTRTGVASVTAALIKLALFASASGAATMATTGDWRQMLRAAGYVALVALLLFGLLAFLAVLAWLGTRGERAEAEDVDIGDPVQTGERQWRVPIQPPFYDVRRLTQCRRWLRDIYYDDATLSQDGTSDKHGGCSYGLTRNEVNAVKDWAIVRANWYYWLNQVNGSGDWTARGRAALETLATAETGDVEDAWERALVVRNASPALNDDESSAA